MDSDKYFPIYLLGIDNRVYKLEDVAKVTSPAQESTQPIQVAVIESRTLADTIQRAFRMARKSEAQGVLIQMLTGEGGFGLFNDSPVHDHSYFGQRLRLGFFAEVPEFAAPYYGLPKKF